MAAPLIPRNLLFSEANRITPQISPDGKHLAFLAVRCGITNLWMGDFNVQHAKPITFEKKRGIIHFLWSLDSKHILYLLDKDGSEKNQLRAVAVDSGEDRALTFPTDGGVQIIGKSKTVPGKILVAIERIDKPIGIYRLTVASGDKEFVMDSPPLMVNWIADSHLNVRAGLFLRDDGGITLSVRETTSLQWKEAIKWLASDSLTSGPIAFNSDDSALYLLDSRGSGTNKLLLLDITTLETSLVAQHTNYDIVRVLFSSIKDKVLAYSIAADRHLWMVIDESVRKDTEHIAALEEGDYYPFSRDIEDRLWVVAYVSDRQPVTFYLYDRNTDKATFLFDHEPRLREYNLAEMKPFKIHARDGLPLHGYLTLPPEGPLTGLPLVLKIHSGPWIRDVWEYDPEVQWLASRGYACLQVNFRGSTGYGKAFLNAGDREWGGRMHEDLIDTIDWVVSSGVADPKRIAAFGLSYGGYAALMAAIISPERFCCVVDLMGPTDLSSFILGLPPHLARYRSIFEKRIGHPKKDAAFLKDRSPLYQAHHLIVPTLVVHTDNDPRVSRADSERLVKKLQKCNKICEYLELSGEGHGIQDEKNREIMYGTIENFFSRYLGGRSQTPVALPSPGH